jgi:hypothetical protein
MSTLLADVPAVSAIADLYLSCVTYERESARERERERERVSERERVCV